MPIQKIISRFDGRTLYECEADSLLAALQQAVKAGANLYRANLSGADLYRANLSGANLYGADLYRANLSRANLYGKLIVNIVQLAGIGSERRATTAIILADSIDIRCGCFHGDMAAFVQQIERHHASNARYLAEYRAAVSWIEACAVACRQEAASAAKGA